MVTVRSVSSFSLSSEADSICVDDESITAGIKALKNIPALTSIAISMIAVVKDSLAIYFTVNVCEKV